MFVLFDEVNIEIKQYLGTKIYAIKVKAKAHVATSNVTLELRATIGEVNQKSPNINIGYNRV